MTDDKSDARVMMSFRLSRPTADLLRECARAMTAKDGVRKVSVTEALERAVRLLAKREGVK